MFRALVLAIILIPSIGRGQDYQMVRSDFVHFFLDENGNDHGMRMDTIFVEGSDSVLMNYLTFRHPDLEVIDACVPSWLGAKTVVRPNGENLFFNSDGDTIHIETLAQLNDNWNLFSIDPASYLEATVTDVSPTVILDAAVEVKTISIQSRDLLGNPLVHPLNGKTIKISNSLGIIQGFDFHLFPNDTTQIEIAGMENPNKGVHRLTYDEAYDFLVGDEFHFKYEKSEDASITPSYWEKRIHRVVGVENQTNERRVAFEVWQWTQQFNGPPSPFNLVQTSTYYNDTVLIESINDLLTESMPSEVTFMFDTADGIGFLHEIRFQHFETSNIPSVTFWGEENSQYYLDTDGLWPLNPSVSGWNYTISAYGKGLGRTYWTHQIGNGVEYLNEEEELIYFKKGNQEWGTPYSISEIMSVENLRNPTERVAAYPNPINIGDLLNLGATYNFVDLLDVSGKSILSVRNANVIATENLSSGIYFVKTESDSGVSIQKLIVTD